jgi:hypothetical protein
MRNREAYLVGHRHGANNMERQSGAVNSCDLGCYEEGWCDGLNDWRRRQPMPEPFCGPRPMPNYHRDYYEGWRNKK